MARSEVTIINRRGLPARCAARLTQAANRYSSEVWLGYGHRRADAKNIMDVILLGVRPGSTIAIEAMGADAEDAVSEVAGLVQQGFGEVE